MNKIARLKSLDALRGLGIVLVVLYHLCFDLDYFGIFGFDFKSVLGLSFEFLVQVLFLSLLGTSMYITYINKAYEDFLKFQFKRGLILSFWALVISLVTYVFLPEAYVRFGVLHLLAFAVFLISLVARSRNLQYFILLLSLSGYVLVNNLDFIVSNEYWIALGVKPFGFNSVDYFPIFPWLFWPVLSFVFGDFLVKIFKRMDDIFSFDYKILSLVGRKTLLIYLLHQPLLFGIFYLFGY